MSHAWRRVIACVAGLALSGGTLAAQQSGGTIPDSLYRRAQRLVNDGDAAAGRSLVDSLVRVTTDGTDARAEAVFWRATLAADPAAAQRDFTTIVVEYALSPRAADALLKLGQTDLDRGDREAARRHLERLVLDHADSPAAADGWYWLGRARFLTSDLPGGCAALDSARARLDTNNVERRNQIRFDAQPCAALSLAAAPSGAKDTAHARDAAHSARDTAPARKAAAPAPKDTAQTTKAAVPGATQYSAQVAAYKLKSDADELARKLRARGYEARVASLTLFHVRIGRFSKRADAIALVAKLKQQQIDAFVVEAEPRGP